MIRCGRFASGSNGRKFVQVQVLLSAPKIAVDFGRLLFFYQGQDLKDERYRATVRWTVVTASDQAPAGARVKSCYPHHDPKALIINGFRWLLRFLFLPKKRSESIVSNTFSNTIRI